MIEPWEEARAFAALHGCSSLPDLERQFAVEMVRLLPGTTMALCLIGDGGSVCTSFAIGDSNLAGGDVVAADGPAWARSRLPIRFRTHELGVLFVARPLEGDEPAIATAALAHFGTAIGNLTLNEEARQATSAYSASVQTLEEGIVLFQEEDDEAVKARLLGLATSLVRTSAGALYVLREVGDRSSGLRLEQTLGIPGSLIETFRAANGSPWPDALLGQAAQLLSVSDDGGLAGLAPHCVPAALRNLLAVPLRYHGVEAGLCLLFNVDMDRGRESELIGRVQSLGQLGAALLHRFRLESINARNRSIERELQIAETIQKRLLPTAAPATPEFAFAWASIAAQCIGGDYLDVFSADRGVVHAVVADASGHGINSALLMSSFRSTYRANAPRQTVTDLTSALNREVVNEVGPTGMFITAALLRIDCATRRLRMTSAGHTPAMVYRASTGRVELLGSDGPPLGFLGGATYTDQVLQLDAGDTLLLYTDGVSEATNADLDMFGEERLATLLQRHAETSPDAILGAIRTSLAQFAGRERHDDDVSMLVVHSR